MRVKVVLKGGQVKIIHRPIQHLYPLEVCSRRSDSNLEATCQTTEDILSPADEDTDQGRHSSTSAELLE